MPCASQRDKFVLLNRKKLVGKLEGLLGMSSTLYGMIRNILTYNKIIMNDNIAISNSSVQTKGVLQDDLLSSLHFNITIVDIQAIMSLKGAVVLYMCPDDMVVEAKNRKEVQEALDTIVK
jgi:hypothetical protein